MTAIHTHALFLDSTTSIYNSIVMNDTHNKSTFTIQHVINNIQIKKNQYNVSNEDKVSSIN